MTAASLELAGISKRYPGVQALSQVSFERRPGEVHAVLGENGSGKSTLLGIASGSVAADKGRVAIMGEALTSADPMLARAPELNPVENVWQYLRANWLSNRVFETYDAIIDAACAAWQKLIAKPQTITSIGMRDWAHVGQTP